MYNSLLLIVSLINLPSDLHNRPLLDQLVQIATTVIVQINTPVLQSNFSIPVGLSSKDFSLLHELRLPTLAESLFRLSASGQISSAISENSILLISHCIANIILLLLWNTVWDLNFFNVAQFFHSVIKVCSNFLIFCFASLLLSIRTSSKNIIRIYSWNPPFWASVSVIES